MGMFFILSLTSCQDDFSQSLDKARQFMQQGKMQEALPLIEKVLAQTDQSADAYNLRGSIFYAQKAYPKAQADFSAAIRLDERQYKYFLNRGHVFHAQNELEKAEADYTAALGLNGSLPEIYLNRGIVFLKRQKTKEALADLNRSINLNKNNANAFLYRGMTHARRNDLPAAIEDFQRALLLDSQLGKAHLELALTQHKASPENPPETICTHLERAQALGQQQAAVYLEEWCRPELEE